MNLKDITLVVHDWGSAIGFHYAMRTEDQAFRTPDVGWDMIVNQNFFIEEILGKLGTVRRLSEDEMAYYREPFRKPECSKAWVQALNIRWRAALLLLLQRL
jgi:haloalkane dehalogenase